MMLRLVAVAGLAAAVLFGAPAFAVTAKQKQETCKFGADDQKLEGAKRKSFMTKCMANADGPAKKPAKSSVPRPNPQ